MTAVRTHSYTINRPVQRRARVQIVSIFAHIDVNVSLSFQISSEAHPGVMSPETRGTQRLGHDASLLPMDFLGYC